MIASLAEMTADSKKVLDQVIQNRETAQIQSQGKTVATVIPAVGVSREEFIRRMNQVIFTPEEREELKRAIEENSKALTNVNSD